MRGRVEMVRAAAVAALVLMGTGVAFGADLAGTGSDPLGADDLLAKAPQIEESSFWYLRADAGYAVNDAPDWSLVPGGTMDDAGVFGLGIGARFSDWLRLDLTADYRTPATYSALGVDGDLSVATMLANVYVDLGSWHKITPYVGAGIGGAYADLDAPGFGSGWGLAWGVMGGVTLELSSNWQLDVGYRYLKIEDVSLGGGLPDLDQSAQEIRIGVRYLIN